MCVCVCVCVCVQSGSSRAELSLVLSKLHSEESSLRDSLVKMSNINESLAQDKSDLSSLVVQVLNMHTFNHSILNMKSLVLPND